MEEVGWNSVEGRTWASWGAAGAEGCMSRVPGELPRLHVADLPVTAFQALGHAIGFPFAVEAWYKPNSEGPIFMKVQTMVDAETRGAPC